MKKVGVLLVDDNEIDCLINERIIRLIGIEGEVHKAHNGNHALRMLREFQLNEDRMPDIILLDLNMPKLDGFGFIQEFQALDFPDKHKTQIIILTSSSADCDIERANRLGRKHYFTKPIDGNRLKFALAENLS